jgi:hypothetical protein
MTDLRCADPPTVLALEHTLFIIFLRNYCKVPE